MKSNRFLLLAAGFALAMALTFSCSGEGSIIDGIENLNSDINTTWYDASKEEFTITTAQQLAGLAKLVNDDIDDFLGKTIKLGKSIDLSGIAWIPIGKESSFAGTFDGNGYEIKGVNIKNSDDYLYNGLFGALDLNGEIKNLGVISSDIKGAKNVGGLVGISNGKISNSYFIGTTVGYENVGGLVGQNAMGTISNSHSDGYVSGKKSDVGGLVGFNGGEISSCYSTSRVIGTDSISENSGKYGEFLGGLVGFNYGNGLGVIMNSYSTGIVTGEYGIGGFVGLNEGEIRNSYSIGAASGDTLVGGFVGLNEGEIRNSFYDMDKNSQIESYGGTGKATAEMKEQATFEGWDFNAVWGLSGEINEGYPYLLREQ